MESTKKAIHSSGLTSARQRAAILKCLRERMDHPDADMVYESVHALMPSISLDTVYRTLKLFSKSGLALQLAAPTHRFRFDGCVSAHDHFICIQCEAVADIPMAHGEAVALPDAFRKIGEVQAMQRVFLGTCCSCREKRRETRAASRIRDIGPSDGTIGAVRSS